MRYTIFFPNGIDLSILPDKRKKANFLKTLVSDKKVVKKDVLVSDFLQIVSMDLNDVELAALQANPNIVIETPTTAELLDIITINGEPGWQIPNEWTGYIGGVDYYYNNPAANPSTHIYNSGGPGITGEIIPSHVSKYRLDRLWRNGFKGQGVNVAVLDTGCAIGQHPDVLISGGVNVQDASLSYTDTIGHGTGMASIIGGRLNGSNVVGLAPEANLYSVKVVGSSGSNPIYGISDSLLAGLEWCFFNNIHVINISLNWGAYSAAAQLAVNKLVKKGVIICCACGNGLWSAARTPIFYPAGYLGVFSISGKRGGHVFGYQENVVFSNLNPAVQTGKTVDYLLEPWIVEAVLTPNIGNAGNGTSESSACFAGIATIMRQRFPYHTTQQLKSMLDKRTTTGTHGFKYFENFDTIYGRKI